MLRSYELTSPNWDSALSEMLLETTVLFFNMREPIELREAPGLTCKKRRHSPKSKHRLLWPEWLERF